MLRLSTPLLPIYSIGGPLLAIGGSLLFAMVIASSADSALEGSFGVLNVVNLCWLVFCIYVVIHFARLAAGLVDIRIDGKWLRISRLHSVRRFPLSALIDVSIKPNHGIALAVFQVRGENEEHYQFRTILQMRFNYRSPEYLSMLAQILNVTIRYIDWRGRVVVVRSPEAQDAGKRPG